MSANLIDAGGLWIEIKFFFAYFYYLLVCAVRPTTTKAGWGKQNTCQWWLGQVVIKTNRSDKIEIKKNLKISVPRQRWPRPLPGAILIPPTLLVVADLFCRHSQVTIMPYRVFQKMNVEHRIWIPAWCPFLSLIEFESIILVSFNLERWTLNHST